ncbi:MAG: hypothetical protein NTY86_04500 [Deltaproteobacteria bacterium]|nr:hypothetical protein [Deltaproteobacteria bacterium]
MEDQTAIIRCGDEETRIETGTVVFSVGARPDDSLCNRFISSVIEVIKAGDCVKPRRILDSVAEGYLAGNRV